MCFIEESGREIPISWKEPPVNGYKVNIDDSYHRSYGMTACGGLIRDCSGKLIKGFHYNLGSCNSVWAELWALSLG